MTLDDPWLAEAWEFVERHLPCSPAAVAELGCGPRGGFVPELIRLGYDAVGIDPDAPDEPAYRRVKFEDVDLPGTMHAVVGCTALHHVADLDRVIDRIATTLRSPGFVVVVEWAWERLDEGSARWCFARLAPSGEADHQGWLQHHQERWRRSGRSWDAYFQAWATGEGLHRAERILEALDGRFERILRDEGPYFFPELDRTSAADEQCAIDSGEIAATCLRYVGALS